MRKIELEEAKKLVSNYKYAYLQMMSEHILEEVSVVSSINWNELIEGYIFSDVGQIHVYREDDELKAVILDDNMGDAHILDKKYELAKKYQSIGKNIIIREYLKADADGQTYVAATRLLGVEE